MLTKINNIINPERKIITPVFNQKIKNGEIVTNVTLSDTDNKIYTTAPAVWDTGCSQSSIGESLAETLNLQPIATTRIKSVVGYHNQFLYKVNFHFKDYLIKDLIVSDMPEVDEIKILIGLDIISKGRLVVEKKRASFEFRY